ncbi:hypothetical protein BN1080_02093 [Planococcus massiliensis]|uniref:Uncharacterized protein n=1 Tax=Planococcus massiliensis TaxID=1499687 RepID=A0A098ELF6_9BACL|nr:hypothetical protein [Planococcus massiliensis]CEG23149.1 hypothetical protein BN1080_02093 [Planococcus massiliensis]
MSEKVLLTKELVQEFESFKVLRNSLDEWARDKQDPNAAKSIIHELSFDQMARAYLIGYEIEKPKFQPGDRVIHINYTNHPDWKKDFKIAEVLKQSEYRSRVFFELKDFGDYEENYIRHATPEEIYWLETLGRDKVMDFHENDIYVDGDGDLFELSQNGQCDNYTRFSSAEKWYKSGGDFKGVYPADAFKPFPKEESK